MAFIDDSAAYDALDNGEFVGRQEPTRESKGGWYEVYRLNGKVYAIAIDRDSNMIFGEEITEDEISQYISC
jgi:hypothetical protein